MSTIKDDRGNKSTPWGFVVCTDTFLSGWGGASEGRSLYALAVDNDDEAWMVLNNARDRSDMKRVRFVKTLPKLRAGDHLSIVDRTCAARWYEVGGFRKDRT